jgi:hypothetical protein
MTEPTPEERAKAVINAGRHHAQEAVAALDIAKKQLEEAIRVLKGTTRTTSQDTPKLVIDTLQGAIDTLDQALKEAQVSEQTATRWASTL